MDASDDSALFPVSGLRKRPRSPELEHDTTGFQSVPMALDYFGTGNPLQPDMKKRRTLSSSTVAYRTTSARNCPTLADLPPEILQHVFTLVDPITLGRLICVNRLFHSLLDPACPLPQPLGSSHVAGMLLKPQDTIWTLSRRAFLHGYPKPMDAMTELEMWRLLRGCSCQYCGRKSVQQVSFSTSDPWNGGPGLDDVRPVWPFRIRSCGRCLKPRLVEDTEVAFSRNSALRSGLAFAFLTDDLNYVPSSALQAGPPPLHMKIIKFYFKSHLEELEKRYNNVRALGDATLREWSKGLEASGSEKYADSLRFEQWELHDGQSRLLALRNRSDTNVLGPASHEPPGYALAKMDRTHQALARSAAGTPSSGYMPLDFSAAGSASGESHYTISKSSNELTPTAAAATGDLTRPGPPGPSSKPVRQKHERSHKEANEAAAERRKEIERRCLALIPPIGPSTLIHMEAFKASILISMPLDDKAWEILKPRLLAQRVEAEHRRMQIALRDPSMRQAERQRLQEEERVAQENTSQMWLGLKVPTRDKIRKFAEEFTRLTWSDGQAVTKATASKFAAEVLTHIRQRFDEAIVQEDHMLALKGTAFPQDQESLSCRKLNLHDMKWAFLEFVQPHTQRFGKELFLCHVCDSNQKLFAFEAMIQHFASKHTNVLSHGSSIVSWEADWPLEPPFDPHPNIPWALGEGATSIGSQHGRPSQSLPSHGLPSAGERASTPGTAITGDHMQYAAQNSHQMPLTRHPGSEHHFPSAYGTRVVPSTVRSSVARSEASWTTMEDEYNSSLQSTAAPHRNMHGARHHRDSFIGTVGLHDHATQFRPFREAPSWDGQSHHLDKGPRWAYWREEQPPSHNSMVYARDNSSSGFSYTRSVAGEPEGVQTRRQAQATDYYGRHRTKGSEHGTSLNDLGASAPSTDTTVANSAVDDFLDSFDPMISGAEQGGGRIDVGTNHTAGYHLPQPMNNPRSLGRPSSQQSSWNAPGSPPASGLSPFSPSAHETSLPIREIDHGTLRAADESVQSRYSRSLPPTRGYGVAPGSGPGRGYAEGSPERPYRTRYTSESESMHGVSSVYSEPMYERRYVYDRDGRRYEEIREPVMRSYSLQHDGFRDHLRDQYVSGGQRYLDDRGYPELHGNRDRAVPRAYHIDDMDRGAQQDRASPPDDRYRGEQPLGAEHQTRTIRFDDREITYQPVEATSRTTSRSLGVNHPDA